MSAFTQQRQFSMPNPASLVVYLLAAVVLLALGVLLFASASPTPAPIVLNANAESSAFNAPDSRLFAAATGRPEFGDDRLWRGLAGAEAALSAVYLGDLGGISVWDIDTATGNGTEVIRVSALDVQTALREADATGQGVLLGTGRLSTLWASPGGGCVINSFYPDGKPYSYYFECA